MAAAIGLRQAACEPLGARAAGPHPRGTAPSGADAGQRPALPARTNAVPCSLASASQRPPGYPLAWNESVRGSCAGRGAPCGCDSPSPLDGPRRDRPRIRHGTESVPCASARRRPGETARRHCASEKRHTVCRTDFACVPVLASWGWYLGWPRRFDTGPTSVSRASDQFWRLAISSRKLWRMSSVRMP